jgi:hypothetical protein
MKTSHRLYAKRYWLLAYYFVGDFDVTLLASMPVSVMPEVISQITSDTKQSATDLETSRTFDLKSKLHHFHKSCTKSKFH